MKRPALSTRPVAAAAGIAFGAVIGAGLLPLCYRPWPCDPIATDGPPLAAFGAVYGALLGLGAASGRVRPLLVGAAIGSALPFAVAHLNTCDGTVLALPAVGAALGAFSGGVAEWIVTSPGRRKPVRSITRSSVHEPLAGP